MAAADDERGFRGNHAMGPRHPGQQPAIKIGPREQPLAGHLGARHLIAGNELVQLALFEPQIVSCLIGRKQLQTCAILHLYAPNLGVDFIEDSTTNRPGQLAGIAIWTPSAQSN